MPLVHLIARVLKENYTGAQLLGAGMLVGLIGFIMVVTGVFIKGDTRQTLLGLIGGIFFWTGWVDFLFMYYAQRFGTQAEMDPVTGKIISRPEYLLLPATFGLWAMVMMVYIFSTRNGCNFLNWWQSRLLGSHKRQIAKYGMTRHVSIITFMEINTMLWTCYLLLMFCYDPIFIGRDHPLTFAVAVGALMGAPFIFRKQLRLRAWGGQHPYGHCNGYRILDCSGSLQPHRHHWENMGNPFTISHTFGNCNNRNCHTCGLFSATKKRGKAKTGRKLTGTGTNKGLSLLYFSPFLFITILFPCIYVKQEVLYFCHTNIGAVPLSHRTCHRLR